MSKSGVRRKAMQAVDWVLWDAVWRSVDAAVYGAVDNAVYTVVERNVDAAVWNATRRAVYENL